MKFEIMGFRQETLMELGLKLPEILLLRWFVDFSGTKKMKEYVNPEDGKTYYWVSYEKVSRDLPLLGENPKTISRRFSRLMEAGVLDSCINNTAAGKQVCFRLKDEGYEPLVEDEKEIIQEYPEEPEDTHKTKMYDGSETIGQSSPLRNGQNCPMPCNINNNPRYTNTRDKLPKDRGDNARACEAPTPEVPVKGIVPESAHDYALRFRDRYNLAIKASSTARPALKVLVNDEINISTIRSHFTEDEIERTFKKVESSDYLLGRESYNGKAFTLSFSKFIVMDFFKKVFEGDYENTKELKKPATAITNDAFENEKGGEMVW